jgi:hypothetical protein
VETQDWRGHTFATDTLALPNGRPFMDIGIDYGRAPAQAIVDTNRQPLLVLSGSSLLPSAC